jgi:hypothetical protein
MSFHLIIAFRVGFLVVAQAERSSSAFVPVLGATLPEGEGSFKVKRGELRSFP